MKADVEVFDTVNIGFGVLGRIEKGTRFSLHRTMVSPHTWFTESETTKFAARVMLVKTVNMEIT